MKKIFGILGILACLGFVQSALAADGADIYKKNCAGCHGMNGEKKTGDANILQGTSAADTHKMLLGYKDGSFGGAQKAMMQKIVSKLSDSDLSDVAQHIGTLK